MSNPKRYTRCGMSIVEDKKGGWVEYSDYAALEAENARLVREAKNDAIAYRAVLERQDELRAERDGARARLAAIQGGMGEQWKDHMTAELVGKLTECASVYGKTQQLRERLRGIIPPVIAQHQRITAAMAAEVERLKIHRARLAESLTEILNGYGYVDYMSEDERQEQEEVIRANAILGEVKNEHFGE